ncbi:hypothetical protein [Hydrogenophaga sp.]|uniref:hypothetical protein n=1 Tax=Hydrogenophaga sp. TaxID=1904254 RepID=UPI00271E9678|nr:hypothetical protein [Hydrogenophaga sp.]MDO9132256.1 hypothetical protein [Hydrogenophaga sp.]
MDLQLATYLGVSILICVLAYKAKWLVRMKWEDPRLYERQESTNQIVILDPRAPQAAMAGLAVASRPSTVAGDIGLVLLVVWMIGFAAGGIFIPTAFGSLREVNTADVAMLLAAALVWGFIFARLFLTAVRLIFTAVIPLVLLTAVAGFVAAFAMGGPDKLMKSIGLDAAVESAVNSPLLNDAAEKRLTRQITKNACSLFQSVVAMGDMDRVRNKCDEDWKEAVRLK